MNLKKITYLTFSLLCGAAVLTSCSVLNGTSSSSSSSKKDKSGAVMPIDREQLMIDKSAKTYSPEELSRGVVKGDWAIETVYGKTATGQNTPYLKFDDKEKRVYGNNGCNTINGAYINQPKDSTIAFSKMLSTMMYCDDEGTSLDVSRALEETRYYRWRLEDSQYFIYFFNSAHHEVMRLMHQNFDFLNGTWQVMAIDEEAIDVTDMKLVIDVDEGKVHGNTGCNIFNGKLETDMDSPNSISFSGIGMTRMACPDGSLETPFIVALENASYARPISPEKVLLLDDQHRVVLELQRTSDK